MTNSEKPQPDLPSYAIDESDELIGWQRWLRGRRRTLLLVMAALAIVAALVAGPAYRELKARRALSLAEGAGRLVTRLVRVV